MTPNPVQAPDVFRAIADPTRRAILGLLAEQALSVGDVAERFEMSRPAVAKHLKVLSDGGLVEVEVRGRSRINRLNAAPLADIAGWLARFEGFWDDKLTALKQEVEGENDQ
ncbi:ArsR/SmtB family transcription factor [Maricaulis parjimensis]|uniref:ArsR/SmtB family transcription factor n=1 Tax=Maricaulis parjimensis TaxID=144023 RepID=UPI00193A0326|nr:metalloregulator ArsR/SmtB family transcription factor [Maricaulis parjimensis]